MGRNTSPQRTGWYRLVQEVCGIRLLMWLPFVAVISSLRIQSVHKFRVDEGRLEDIATWTSERRETIFASLKSVYGHACVGLRNYRRRHSRYSIRRFVFVFPFECKFVHSIDDDRGYVCFCVRRGRHGPGYEQKKAGLVREVILNAVGESVRKNWCKFFTFASHQKVWPLRSCCYYSRERCIVLLREVLEGAMARECHR